MGEIGFCDIWRAGERTMPAFLEPKLKNGPTTPMERRPDPQLGLRSGLLGWVPGLSGANVSPEWVEDHGSREGLRGGLNHTRLQPPPYRSILAGGGGGGPMGGTSSPGNRDRSGPNRRREQCRPRCLGGAGRWREPLRYPPDTPRTLWPVPTTPYRVWRQRGASGWSACTLARV